MIIIVCARCRRVIATITPLHHCVFEVKHHTREVSMKPLDKVLADIYGAKCPYCGRKLEVKPIDVDVRVRG